MTLSNWEPYFDIDLTRFLSLLIPVELMTDALPLHFKGRYSIRVSSSLLVCSVPMTPDWVEPTPRWSLLGKKVHSSSFDIEIWFLNWGNSFDSSVWNYVLSSFFSTAKYLSKVDCLFLGGLVWSPWHLKEWNLLIKDDIWSLESGGGDCLTCLCFVDLIELIVTNSSSVMILVSKFHCCLWWT